MTAPTLIDQACLDELSAQARQLPRLRRNRNFHPTDDAPAHRLLNGVEPGSYIRPHRHLDPAKDETLVVLRGRFGLVLFDEEGRVRDRVVLAAGGPALGMDIPHGCFHAILSLAPDSVFFEAKAGPFLPLTEAEKAPWAPPEGAPEAAAYLASLEALFA